MEGAGEPPLPPPTTSEPGSRLPRDSAGFQTFLKRRGRAGAAWASRAGGPPRQGCSFQGNYAQPSHLLRGEAGGAFGSRFTSARPSSSGPTPAARWTRAAGRSEDERDFGTVSAGARGHIGDFVKKYFCDACQNLRKGP